MLPTDTDKLATRTIAVQAVIHPGASATYGGGVGQQAPRFRNWGGGLVRILLIWGIVVHSNATNSLYSRLMKYYLNISRVQSTGVLFKVLA